VHGVVDAARFDAYISEFETLLERNERFAAVFDARHARPLDVRLVEKKAKWMDDNAQRLKRLNVGIAFVIPSPMIRGVLQAILWLHPIPQPYNVCDAMPQALDWIARRLRQNGLRVPDLRGVG
jgi:hypothetical protein